jgi:hypothetical protein
VRLAIAAAAPLLASTALVAFAVWELYGWTLFAALTALIASACAILVAPSRALVALGIGSFATASITLILWWDAVWEIAKSS